MQIKEPWSRLPLSVGVWVNPAQVGPTGLAAPLNGQAQFQPYYAPPLRSIREPLSGNLNPLSNLSRTPAGKVSGVLSTGSTSNYDVNVFGPAHHWHHLVVIFGVNELRPKQLPASIALGWTSMPQQADRFSRMLKQK